VFNMAGQLRPGFPVTTVEPVWSGVAVADLSFPKDGQKELVFGTNWNKLYAYRANGLEWRDGDGNAGTTGVFKLLGDGANYGTPALVDLDKNGQTDIVYGSFDKRLYAWRPDGTNLPGFPVVLTARITSSAAIGDLDNDGQWDIVFATGDYSNSSANDSL
jgi:hypothetical protein